MKLLVGTRKGLWSLTSEDRAAWSASEPAFFGQIVQHAVAELIYHPPRTLLMAEAAARGARTANGLSMLVHQAAVAFVGDPR